jgi:hypothetical protein
MNYFMYTYCLVLIYYQCKPWVIYVFHAVRRDLKKVKYRQRMLLKDPFPGRI